MKQIQVHLTRESPPAAPGSQFPRVGSEREVYTLDGHFETVARARDFVDRKLTESTKWLRFCADGNDVAVPLTQVRKVVVVDA